MSIQTPINLAFTTIGTGIGSKYLNKTMFDKSKNAMTKGFAQYISVIVLSILPSILINAIITKNQKKASRVADMMAINDLSDYRHFADYSEKN